MASLYAHAFSVDYSNEDWMDNDIAIGPSVARASADVQSQKSVPIHSGPKVKPAAVSWMRPQPSNGPGHALVTPRKSAGSQRNEWDKTAALATAATIQIAKASEAAVRLADMAVRQMAGTAAVPSEHVTPAKRRGRKPVFETPNPALPISESRSELLEELAGGSGVKRKRQTGKSQANIVQSTAKSQKSAKKQPEDEDDDAEHPGGDDDEDPEAEVEDPAAEEESEDSDAKKAALMIKCGSGTFAGYRPPKEEANLEVFNLKKSSYFKTRRELEQKYPGRLHLCGKSITQLDWWNHLRTQIAKAKSKATKQSPYTRDKLKITISEAGVEWKSKLQALMEDASTE